MPPDRSLLLDSAILLALILIGVVGYRLSPFLAPQADITVMPEPGCDLQKQACSAQLSDDGRLVFSILPRPIPVAKPLELSVDIFGLSARQVSVDFAGVTMDMGFNRPQLHAVSAGRFTGAFALPICLTGRMTWQATVLVESERARYAIPFRFEAG